MCHMFRTHATPSTRAQLLRRAQRSRLWADCAMIGSARARQDTPACVLALPQSNTGTQASDRLTAVKIARSSGGFTFSEAKEAEAQLKQLSDLVATALPDGYVKAEARFCTAAHTHTRPCDADDDDF
jgi:hypothetical protein